LGIETRLRLQFRGLRGALTWVQVLIIDISEHDPTMVSTRSNVEIVVSKPPNVASVRTKATSEPQHPKAAPKPRLIRDQWPRMAAISEGGATRTCDSRSRARELSGKGRQSTGSHADVVIYDGDDGGSPVLSGLNAKCPPALNIRRVKVFQDDYAFGKVQPSTRRNYDHLPRWKSAVGNKARQ